MSTIAPEPEPEEPRDVGDLTETTPEPVERFGWDDEDVRWEQPST